MEAGISAYFRQVCRRSFAIESRPARLKLPSKAFLLGCPFGGLAVDFADG